jgi:hypothetical protein
MQVARGTIKTKNAREQKKPFILSCGANVKRNVSQINHETAPQKFHKNRGYCDYFHQ